MLWRRFVIANQQRGLVTKNGNFGGILTPGEYAMFIPPHVALEVERHDIREIVFRSAWADYLAKQRRDLVERYFTPVETNEVQVAMVYVNGRLFHVLTPKKRLLFWRGAAEITCEVVEVIAKAVPPPEDRIAAKPMRRPAKKLPAADEAEMCLFFVHSRLARRRTPGKRGFEVTAWEMGLLERTAIELSEEFGSRMTGSLIAAGVSLRRKQEQVEERPNRKLPYLLSALQLQRKEERCGVGHPEE